MTRMPLVNSLRSKAWVGLLTSACAMALNPATALAQDEPGNVGAPDEAIVVTGERAYAATKTDTELVEVPQGISVVTSEEIQERTAVDLQDVYRYTPGVDGNTSVDSRGDFVVVRGFDAEQYLDGLKRQPSFIYGARLEPFTLQSAEVLRGPSSVLYGAGGSGGVMNGVSKRPQFVTGGEVSVGIGTDDKIQGQFDITGGLSERFAARFVGMLRDGKTQWGTPDDRMVINPSLRWQPAPSTDITLIGLWQEDKQGSLGYAPLYKSFLAPTDAERVAFNFYQGEPGFNGMDTTWLGVTLILEQGLGDWASFRSASRYADMDTDYREVYSDYSNDPFADDAETLLKREFYVNFERSKVFNSDNHVLLDVTTGPISHKFLLGLDYTWFKQSKNEGFSCSGFVDPSFGCLERPAPINIYDPEPTGLTFGAPLTTRSDYKSLGFYAQDQLSFQDRVHVVLGVRRDDVSSESNGDSAAWSLRGGIIAEVVEGISPYFNYAESFLPIAGTNIRGERFSPKTGRQYEAGVKWEPMRGALLALAYFDIAETNFLVQDPTDIQNFIQGGEVSSKGFEAEAAIRVPGDYTVTASYSFIDAKVSEGTATLVEGDRMPGQARHLASVWGSKTVMFGDGWILKPGLGVRYIGNRVDSSQTLINPSVTLVDAALTVGKQDWELSLTSSNLLDKKYYDLCSALNENHGLCTAAKDRTVIASLRRRF